MLRARLHIFIWSAVAAGLLAACAASTPQAAGSPVVAGQAQVSELDIRAAYDRLAAQPQPIEYKVRHILVDTQEKAQAALDRIHRGEPFNVVAGDVSVDGGSMFQGGDLGWNLPAYFAPEFSKAMVALAPKGLSAAPLHSQFGWHVIEVTDARPKAFPPYEQVRDQIAEGLRRRAMGQQGR